MARKRRIPKLTAEDHARFAETTRRLRERIAHHERLAQQEEARAKRRAG